MTSRSLAVPAAPAHRRTLGGIAERHPIAGFFVVFVLTNLAGAIFNILYNRLLIVEGILTPAQRRAFYEVALPAFNLWAWSFALIVLHAYLRPVSRALRRLRDGDPVSEAELGLARRRVISTPFWVVVTCVAGWLPGAAFFPGVICGLGGSEQSGLITLQFVLSFCVSTLLTTTQTLFLIEAYLVRVVYRELFRDARPAETPGIRVSFGVRIGALWLATNVMPMLALYAIAWNFTLPRVDHATLGTLSLSVLVVGGISGGVIFWVMGRDIQGWIRTHGAATARIATEDFAVRVLDRRPDELGQLTDGFNDMAAALERAQSYERLQDLRNENARLVLEMKSREVAQLESFLERLAGHAHDLGGPEIAIAGAIDALESAVAEPALDTEELARIAARASMCARDLEALVKSAKDELRHAFMPPLEATGVRHVIEAVRERLELRFPEVTVTLDGAGAADVNVRGGALGLARVLENLGLNACDAAGPNGRVVVSWMGGEQVVQIVVEDSGPGFSEPALSQKVGGLGIGLYSARRILETSGGSLELSRSETLGGARVEVTLPVANAPALR